MQSFEVVPIAHGRRPGMITGYRICQRCRTGRAEFGVIHKRRWFEFFPKTELVCEDCRPRTPGGTIRVTTGMSENGVG